MIISKEHMLYWIKYQNLYLSFITHKKRFCIHTIKYPNVRHMFSFSSHNFWTALKIIKFWRFEKKVFVSKTSATMFLILVFVGQEYFLKSIKVRYKAKYLKLIRWIFLIYAQCEILFFKIKIFRFHYFHAICI